MIAILLIFLISISTSGCLTESFQQIEQYTQSATYISTQEETYKLDISKLTVPEVPDTPPHKFEKIPTTTSSSRMIPGFSLSSHYYYTKLYEGGTGTFKIFVENSGNTPVFIYGYAIRDPNISGINESYMQNTGITIPAGEERYIGMFNVMVPQETDQITLGLSLSILVKTISGTWYDHHEQLFDNFTMDVIPAIAEEYPERVSNLPQSVFKSVNNKVNPLDINVREIAAGSAKTYPGTYNIYQICAIFDYVKENIQYISDPRGGDYWSPPNETLKIGAGDCDDYAILMSSLVEAIGGTTRIYLTDTHAFAAVYIGNDTDHIDRIVDGIGQYYGPVAVYYSTDEYGSWLMLDPTSSLYVGDLPGDTALTSQGWTYLNTTKITAIDIIPK
ncbi:MAG: transglutaminase family protein [Methanosarcinaceae archaeon]|nr:transglutaminase family protein [Methanosarcinaceae archaeon]